MKRKIYNELLAWKNANSFKPLMIMGARQVGKTYIIREFCKNEFSNFVEINLFQRNDIINLYKNKELNSSQKFNRLKTILEFDIDLPNTILFIDEIQQSEELISELKYFCEEHNNVRIICAGSLLGVKLKRMQMPFPVGKVKRLTLYPMDFEEFLLAMGQVMLIEEIKKCYLNNVVIVEPLHIKALEFYRYYLITGGMPESVKNFKDVNQDIIKYDLSIRNEILTSYFDDMAKYVKDKSDSLKIRQTYESIAPQLSNENKKFKYSDIDKYARSREYEVPLDWLVASDLVYKNYRVTIPKIPLEGFKKDDMFKLFYNDVGFIISSLNIKPADIMTDNLSLYKGAIAENYVANQLIVNGYNLYYWQSDGIAEIDFLIYTKDGVIPVLVKAGDATKSKSLNSYIDKFKPKYAIRISTKNFGYDKDKCIKSVPLYATFCINE